MAEARAGMGSSAWRRAASALLAMGWVPALAACSLSADPRTDRPDRTVAFETGWEAAADCSAQQLGNLYAVAQLSHYPDQGYAEIVVGMGRDTTGSYAAGLFYNAGTPAAGSSGYSDSGTIMIIDFHDVHPRQAEARIYAARYMLLPGAPTEQAATAMAACKNASATAPMPMPPPQPAPAKPGGHMANPP
jgi:hypothetical protein